MALLEGTSSGAPYDFQNIREVAGQQGGNPAGGGGMNPLLIASIASSLFGGLFGGNDGPQERKSYSGRVSPQNTLQDALDAIKSFGAGLEQRGPVQLRSAVVPGGGMEPVRVPGLGIQIGGGLGMDPALKDPSLLTGRSMGSSVFGDLVNRSGGGTGGGTGIPGQRGVTDRPGSATLRKKTEGLV